MKHRALIGGLALVLGCYDHHLLSDSDAAAACERPGGSWSLVPDADNPEACARYGRCWIWAGHGLHLTCESSERPDATCSMVWGECSCVDGAIPTFTADFGSERLTDTHAGVVCQYTLVSEAD
ncbi:MAG: hypothetical protein KF901_10880 [Myxococcales bacterium]|nr:hypothetical protein [Myxococcales bacterium]